MRRVLVGLDRIGDLGTVGEQALDLIGGESAGNDDRNLNPSAVALIRQHLGGIDEELDDALSNYAHALRNGFADGREAAP